jgi:hypothetical protein
VVAQVLRGRRLGRERESSAALGGVSRSAEPQPAANGGPGGGAAQWSCDRGRRGAGAAQPRPLGCRRRSEEPRAPLSESTKLVGLGGALGTHEWKRSKHGAPLGCRAGGYIVRVFVHLTIRSLRFSLTLLLVSPGAESRSARPPPTTSVW